MPDRVKEYNSGLQHGDLKVGMSKDSNISQIHTLILLLFTFVFLSSIYYKGFAFALLDPSFYVGFRIPYLSQKVALVTGLGSSLSQVTAIDLARKGAHVISIAPSSEVKENVLAKFNKEKSFGKLDVFVVDMASLKAIKEFNGIVKKSIPNKIDYVILNEDLFAWNFNSTIDGIESMFAVNYLSQFLLISGLFEKIKSSKTRVLITTNYAYRMSYRSGIAFNQLKSNVSFNAPRAYSQSKLANIVYATELARRLKGSGATANSVYPGLVSESIFIEKSWVYGQNYFASMTPHMGSKTLVSFYALLFCFPMNENLYKLCIHFIV
jgi:retinol dehydrogenase 14